MANEASSGIFRLGGLPRLDRFFPNCLFGLVELVARARFGFTDIKKIWFGNAFVYSPPSRNSWLQSNGFELDARIGLPMEAHTRARARLMTYYGISLRSQPIADTQQLIAAVEEAWGRGAPLISSFDLEPLRKGRRRGAFRPHYVAVVGGDLRRGRFQIVDSVAGELEVSLPEYEAALERYGTHGAAFGTVAVACRSPGVNVALDVTTVAGDVDRSLANLRSDEPNTGLNGLRRFATDLRTAHEALRQPFYIPGLWICSHDRHCFRRALRYWKEAAPSLAMGHSELDAHLRAAFDLWFAAHVTVERSLAESRRELMTEVVDVVEHVIEVETKIAHVLGQIAGSLRGVLGAAIADRD